MDPRRGPGDEPDHLVRTDHRRRQCCRRSAPLAVVGVGTKDPTIPHAIDRSDRGSSRQAHHPPVRQRRGPPRGARARTLPTQIHRLTLGTTAARLQSSQSLPAFLAQEMEPGFPGTSTRRNPSDPDLSHPHQAGHSKSPVKERG